MGLKSSDIFYHMTNPTEAWNSLSAWLNRWFNEPDLEALKIQLCALGAHYYENERPLWLFCIGSSGSGKTGIVVQTLRGMPQAKIIGALTPKCFLSHWQHGKEEASLLLRDGSEQIWIAKDFTTIASMRFEARAEIAARLREIWDGELISNSGAGSQKCWKGKITVLAMATPECEENWSIMSGLGERFLTVRWRDPQDPIATMMKVRTQMGHTDSIADQSRKHIEEIVSARWKTAPTPGHEVMHKLDATARVVAKLRVRAVREGGPARNIVQLPEPESPTRISLALSQIIRTHMDLFHHYEPGYEEFNLASRLAIDTIPSDRRKIIEQLALNQTMTLSELLKRSKIPRTTFQRQIEELRQMEVLDVAKHTMRDWESRTVSYTSDFSELCREAWIVIRPDSKVIRIQRRTGQKIGIPLS